MPGVGANPTRASSFLNQLILFPIGCESVSSYRNSRARGALVANTIELCA
jgi:hypothetical protein